MRLTWTRSSTSRGNWGRRMMCLHNGAFGFLNGLGTLKHTVGLAGGIGRGNLSRRAWTGEPSPLGSTIGRSQFCPISDRVWPRDFESTAATKMNSCRARDVALRKGARAARIWIGRRDICNKSNTLRKSGCKKEARGRADDASSVLLDVQRILGKTYRLKSIIFDNGPCFVNSRIERFFAIMHDGPWGWKSGEGFSGMT